MKAVKAPVKIINLDMGMASWVENLRIRIRMGIKRPPPPMPPAFETAEPITMEIAPMISAVEGGENGLCSHLWL